MSYRPDQVEFLCNSIEDLTPVNGGEYTRQLRVGLSMSRAQINAAILNLLGDMPEPDAYALLAGEFPEWFKVEA